MKLVIQIPCFNEEETLPGTLSDLPDSIPGIDTIETLVIDDGSMDRTAEVAREHGIDRVVEIPCNKGLAYAWSVGIDTALASGADIVVNTDGDNQYRGEDVAELVRPILEREADMVIGARPIEDIEHFSWLKKRLQWVGSWIVSQCCGTTIEDAASGFRAYSREAAFELNVLSDYSHCTESLIRAVKRGIKIKSVPIRVNEPARESRLMSSLPHYLYRQGRDIFHVVTMLHPLSVFGIPTAVFLLVGGAGCLRFLYFYATGDGSGHVQSLLFSVMCIIVGFIVGLVGLIADMISSNHQLIEDSLSRLKKLELSGHQDVHESDQLQ